MAPEVSTVVLREDDDRRCDVALLECWRVGELDGELDERECAEELLLLLLLLDPCEVSVSIGDRLGFLGVFFGGGSGEDRGVGGVDDIDGVDVGDVEVVVVELVVVFWSVKSDSVIPSTFKSGSKRIGISGIWDAEENCERSNAMLFITGALCIRRALGIIAGSVCGESGSLLDLVIRLRVAWEGSGNLFFLYLLKAQIFSSNPALHSPLSKATRFSSHNSNDRAEKSGQSGTSFFITYVPHSASSSLVV